MSSELAAILDARMTISSRLGQLNLEAQPEFWHTTGVFGYRRVQITSHPIESTAKRFPYPQHTSDAVKQQYWVYVSMQRRRSQVGNVRLYPVQLPEQRIDGAIFQPTTKYLRIEE